MNWFSYTFKKSPLFRFVVFILLLSVGLILLRLFFSSLSKKPTITNVFPSVIELNDTVTIIGENFGKPDEARGLRFEDEFLPSTDCISWSDDKITFKAPKNFKTSLISVSIGNDYSKQVVLTAESEIPKVLQKQLLVSLPEITSVSRDNGKVGQSITIYGKNFGTTRQNSAVVFTESSEELVTENAANLEGVYCNETEYDFIRWSDNEITIYIPDGATSGNMLVQTSAGLSNFVPFRVSTTIGKKKLSNKRNITLLLSVSVKDIKPSSKRNTLFLLIPQPTNSYRQKNVSFLTSESELFARNFQNSNIYRFENLTDESEVSASEKLQLETYDVDVEVNSKNVSAGISLKPEMLKYTSSQIDIPSNHEEIRKLVNKITDGNKNPYNNAKKIFDYILKNIKPAKRGLNDSPNVLKCLKTKLADTYELSLIFCTLLRAKEIPCIQVSGIIIGKDQNAHLHWWNEFYIEGVGWIPVDIALAIGEPFVLNKTTEEFFAHLDGLHIAFSRDKQMQSQMLSDSMLINKTKNYSSRQIWEESSGLSAYSSLWNIPKIISIY